MLYTWIKYNIVCQLYVILEKYTLTQANRQNLWGRSQVIVLIKTHQVIFIVSLEW